MSSIRKIDTYISPAVLFIQTILHFLHVFYSSCERAQDGKRHSEREGGEVCRI